LIVISQFKTFLLRPILRCIPVGLLFISMLFAIQHASGQITIRGTVFNMYRTRPLEAVSVISTSGNGTITDSAGFYMIIVNENDSIIYSYLGKHTMKFPVKSINLANNFDIALNVNPTELREVKIFPRNYTRDSIQNRQDYAKVFNFRKPGVSITAPGQGLGAGFDLDELIDVFRFQRNRRMLAFQRRLEDEERDKFIDHRFNRSIVKKTTRIDDSEIDSFMVRYRPSFEFCKTSNDYDLLEYIKLAYQEYRGTRPRNNRLILQKKVTGGKVN
jgi:hypothetical protein